jgi:hypothetical protein
MGKPVILDSDDVECLLLASAISKEIEARFRSLRDDPQVMRLNNKVGDAFSRINRARGDAIRIEEPFDSVLMSKKDWEILRFLEDGNPKELGTAWNPPLFTDEVHSTPTQHDYFIVTQYDLDKLRRFRLVIVGELIATTIIKWGDKTEDSTIDAMGKQFVKIAPRGQATLQQHRNPHVPN